ncbi:MAG: hypothetical protein R2770_20045 [Acidimicrobiales bacterium]
MRAGGGRHPGGSVDPRWAVKAVGVFSKPLGELMEVAYQFDAPFFVDSSDTTEALGLHPTPLADQVAATIEDYRRGNSKAA